MVITVFDFEATDKIPAQSEILTGFFTTFNLETYEPVDQLSVTSKPEKYKKESFEFHGISAERAAAFTDKQIALRRILRYCHKYKEGLFCCHARASMFGITGYFDWQLLRLSAFYESDAAYFWFCDQFRRARVISTHTMAKRLIHLPNYELANVAGHFGHTFKPHIVEEDVGATVHSFKRLLALSGINRNNHHAIYELGNGIEFHNPRDLTEESLPIFNKEFYG